MKLKKIPSTVFSALCLLLIFSILFPSSVFAAKKRKKAGPYRVSAKSAIYSDSTMGRRLYGKNVNLKVPPASTTKVMTVLLVLENLPLNKYVTVTSSATMVQPTKLNLTPGEQYRVSDLLYALLLKSANDASVVLAQAVAGSEGEFVEMMNRRARQLGAIHTKFANSNGLPMRGVTQYTTAYDMFLIFRQALRHDFFKTALSYKYKTIYSKARRKHYLKSHNKLLFTDWGKSIHGKTGYTRAAQSCFVGYIANRKTVRIIAVFGCNQRWKDIRHIINKF